MTEPRQPQPPAYSPRPLSTRLVTSRRVKHEETNALRQTAILVAAAIIILILTVLIIIPGVIRFVGGLSSGTTVTEQQGLPPQVPQLAAPYEATYSATLTVTGFTTPKAKVIIVKNGEQQKEKDADEAGNFSVPVKLDQGENHLSAFAKNGDLESQPSQEFVTVLDTEPPKLEVTEPVDNQTIQGKKNQTVTVKGKTKPKAKLYLNDRLIFLADDGTFTTTQRLENGANSWSFRIVDNAGNITEQKMTVNFQE